MIVHVPVYQISKHLSFAYVATEIVTFLKIESAADISVLRADLNLFSVWVTRLRLILNLDKCYSPSYSIKYVDIHYSFSFLFVNTSTSWLHVHLSPWIHQT